MAEGNPPLLEALRFGNFFWQMVYIKLIQGGELIPDGICEMKEK